MDSLLSILWSFSDMIIKPPMILILVAMTFYFYSKNKKAVAMQKIICGGVIDSSLELTLSQITMGILGGFLVSILLWIFGIKFTDNYSIIILFYISLLLVFINARFICFSYSGCVLGLACIIVKILNKMSISVPFQKYIYIDIMNLIVLIGIMHIIEGLLVSIDGDKGAIPVFCKKDGNILGGYSMKRHWILPTVIMLSMSASTNNNEMGNYISNVPFWWGISGTILISLMNFFGIIGFSSITFTRSKREKAIFSGKIIALFGVTIIIFAQCCRFGIIGEILSLLFMVLSHELMLKYQRAVEETGEPKYISNNNGLTILEVVSNSVFDENDIVPGSKILAVNDKSIQSEIDIYKILKENMYNAIIKISDINGNQSEIKFKHKKNTRIGVLVVPSSVNDEEMVSVDRKSFNNILHEIKKKHIK